jgi:hypothetical protein
VPDPSAPDPDWYLDNVVVPSGIERRPIGPVRGWQGSWESLALRLMRTPRTTPLAEAIAFALGQGFVLTREQARRCGMSDPAVRQLVRRGDWMVCGRGAIAVIAPPLRGKQSFDAARRVHALRAAAATAKRSGHVTGTASAAVVHGLPTLEVPSLPELLTASGRTYGRLDAARVRFADLASDEIDSWFGIPLTTVARTVVDLARVDPSSGLMAADAALHEGLLTRAQMTTALERSTGAPGVRRAREVLALADARIESPLESLTHLALHDSGFPTPELQLEIRGADGRTYWADFAWPSHRLVLEADGKDKYRDDALWREKRREIAITRVGYRVVRVVWDDVVRDWPATSVWLRDMIGPDRSV